MPTDFDSFRDRIQAKLFELLPAHLDRLGWDRSDFIVLTSGGSSGVRGTFVFEVDTFATFAATLLRPAIARLQAAGGLPSGGVQLAIVGAESPIHATGAFPCVLEGFSMSCVSVPVTLPIGSIVERLNELQPPVLYGYTSILAQLAVEQRAGRLHIAPTMVTATGETLRADLRRAIADGFGAPIVNTYGSSEGLTGVSAPDDLAVSFADDCCIVELVDEHGRPVEPGEPSAAVLVTNLYNRVQPLIRYWIDDRFVRWADAPEHGHLRAEVDGRASDVLRFGNVAVHPHVITTRLAHSASILDYQIRQVERGVAVSVVATDGLDAAAVAANVRSGLAAAGMGNATVEIEAVRELPRDPRTGKLTAFVPLRTA